MKTFYIDRADQEIWQKELSFDRYIAVFGWIAILLSYLFTSEINYLGTLVIALITYSSFVKTSKDRQRAFLRDDTLEFAENCLLYKSQDAVLWSIPYERLGNIQHTEQGGGFKGPVWKEVLITTNDGDSYCFQYAPKSLKLDEIQHQIDEVKERLKQSDNQRTS